MFQCEVLAPTHTIYTKFISFEINLKFEVGNVIFHWNSFIFSALTSLAWPFVKFYKASNFKWLPVKDRYRQYYVQQTTFRQH